MSEIPVLVFFGGELHRKSKQQPRTMFEMEREYLLYVSFSIFTGLVIQTASTVQITHSNNKIILPQIFPRYLCIKK